MSLQPIWKVMRISRFFYFFPSHTFQIGCNKLNKAYKHFFMHGNCTLYSTASHDVQKGQMQQQEGQHWSALYCGDIKRLLSIIWLKGVQNTRLDPSWLVATQGSTKKKRTSSFFSLCGLFEHHKSTNDNRISIIHYIGL